MSFPTCLDALHLALFCMYLNRTCSGSFSISTLRQFRESSRRNRRKLFTPGEKLVPITSLCNNRNNFGCPFFSCILIPSSCHMRFDPSALVCGLESSKVRLVYELSTFFYCLALSILRMRPYRIHVEMRFPQRWLDYPKKTTHRKSKFSFQRARNVIAYSR